MGKNRSKKKKAKPSSEPKAPQVTAVVDPVRSPLWVSVVMAVLSAGLFALAFPGGAAPWLAWVAFVPLIWVLRQARGFWHGAFFGLLFGWLIWLSSVWWLAGPFREMLGLSATAAILLTVGGCFLWAVAYSIASGVVTRWIPAQGVTGATAAAAIFTLATTWMGFVFQGNIVHSQYKYPMALQVLELGGGPLLLFAIYWVNCLLADAVRLLLTGSEQRTEALKLAAGAVIVLGLVFGYGAVRLAQFDSYIEAAGPENTVLVGAIQPNLPIRVSAERQPAPEALDNTFYTALDQALHLVETHLGIDLLVLPENPDFFNFNTDTNRRGALGRMIRITGIPVVANVDGLDGEDPPGRYNISVFVDENRDLAGTYVKMKRLPLVEYLPWEERLPWLRTLFPASLRVVEGAGPKIFPLNENVRVIPLICYEATMSAFTRQFVLEGGNLIVNQTNDSWFLRTPASEIHFSLALFRTVEYRVPMVRATNSGVGAHVQPNGRIVPGSETELFVAAETAFPLYVPPERSVYASVGDTWQWGLVLYLAGFIWTVRRRRAPGKAKPGGGRKARRAACASS